MTTNDCEMSNQDEAIRAHLVAGLSYTQTAEALGVSASTVTRRMSMATFRQSVEMGRAEHLEFASSRVLSLVGEAVEVLADAMMSGSLRDKMKAAESVLGYASRLPALAAERREAASSVTALARSKYSLTAMNELLGLDPWDQIMPDDEDLTC